MAMTKLYAEIEFATGNTTTVRVLLADKLLYETTARKHDWTFDPNSLTGQVFLAWAAAKRTGKTTATFEEFRDSQAVDVFLTNDAPAGETDEDPTSESGRH